jgi:hypothetical protein
MRYTTKNTKEEKAMVNYFVVRDGEIKMTLVNPVIKPDGSIWTNGNPLLDSQSESGKALGRDELSRLAKAHKWDEIPEDVYAHIGTNPSGLVVISQTDYRDQVLAARTPAQAERERIHALYRKANARYNASDDCNVMDYYKIKEQADADMKTWREKYPEDAKEEKRTNLKAQADEERHLAQGALVYDSDGWLNEAARQTRHDEFIAKAVDLESQANNL